MQFSVVALVAALAATVYAHDGPHETPVYGNGTSVAYPVGTASATGTGAHGTGAPSPSSTGSPEFPGAANQVTGSALAIVVAGGVAMML